MGGGELEVEISTFGHPDLEISHFRITPHVHKVGNFVDHGRLGAHEVTPEIKCCTADVRSTRLILCLKSPVDCYACSINQTEAPFCFVLTLEALFLSIILEFILGPGLLQWSGETSPTRSG